jgi:PAS domain S-box-containing protein
MMSAHSTLSAIERQQLLLDAVVDYAIYWLGPTGYIESWNPGGYRIKGYDAHEVLGRHFRMFFPPENQFRADELLAQAAAEGRVEAEGWRVRKDGTRFWALSVIDAIYGATGDLIGFAKITRDMTERRRAQEELQASHRRLEEANRALDEANAKLKSQLAAHQSTLEELRQTQERLEARVLERTAQIERSAAHSQILLRELAHRSKNLMAIIGAMARHSLKDNGDPKHFVSAFTARLDGISHSYDLLFNDDWNAVSLADLVKAQVMPFTGGAKLVVSGPEMRISAAATQALGMVFHELATNSMKYGALSAAGAGKVEVTWHLSGDELLALTLQWREIGGPPVNPPEKTGWGTWVIRNMASQVLNGEVQLQYPSTGIVWTLRAPLGQGVYQKIHELSSSPKPPLS